MFEAGVSRAAWPLLRFVFTTGGEPITLARINRIAQAAHRAIA